MFSATMKQIPNLPIVTVSENEVAVQVAPKGTPAPQPKIDLKGDDWTRWNDYGIGTLPDREI